MNVQRISSPRKLTRRWPGGAQDGWEISEKGVWSLRSEGMETLYRHKEGGWDGIRLGFKIKTEGCIK